ncbi:T9SS-dependent M36 family metallopeptidase [Hymenobacter weizhouensis]|uniref:T9SS-dependent M36 family metallopeptidase n=1 Tax=Hymenobacter sp. YIM 151500-1 TaxID=2987689 RepID=UPI0022274C55|nr:T9SS-dependent M36 family metallopeptidase [Hymenobacter sp. YIM 151500-1]UYZ62723.1 T9SS-dependent M36 family metallopeptidase [Hymenobacter sp. YIM 151500-1]
MKLPLPAPLSRALLTAGLLALPGLLAAQTTSADLARTALQVRTQALGLKPADVSDPVVTNSFTDEHSGVTHVYLRQRYQGVEVYNGVADVHLAPTGRVVGLNSRFVSNAAVLARPATPALTAEQAVGAAARALAMAAPSGLRVQKAGTPAAGLEFTNGGISLERIPVKLMYLPMPSGELRLVWDVMLYPHHARNYWSVRVDAATGELLDKHDYVIEEEFSMAPLRQPIASLAAASTPTPARPSGTTAANSYHVWPVTIESPTHGARQVVTAPADLVASPFGWHDVDGKAGADSLRTAGNNVTAYEDRSNKNTGNNPWTVGYAPKGGPNQIFDFPFDNTIAANPRANLDAAITNLFYWNNLMHDIMARKGFTEGAGNFQTTNYTGKGASGDAVQAEAQDGGGLNNANFGTPPDGFAPRMQMYLWDANETKASITAPASLAGPLVATEGTVTRKLAKTGPVSGNLVLVNDGTATPQAGCAAYSNAADVQGNFALVDLGNCTNITKVRNAQAAGARAIIIIQNTTAPPFSFGVITDTAGVRIPGVMISQADGNRIKAALQAGNQVSVTLTETITYYRDGDFDNGIVAHEYGHGISTRLAGGASNASCLRSAEQMGEGWSDFFGLWITTRPGDKGTTGRGIGTYASFEPTTGGGIRPTRYSTDVSINPSTYDWVGKTIGGVNFNLDADNRPRVHAIGYIWASALWDLNWALIEKYGYNEDLRAKTGGNNIALQLVIDGLKLQPCNPGFIDGRDAILKADSITNNAANSAIIWRVFARRGMGFSARQGSSNSLTDQVAATDLPRVLSTQKKLSEELLELYPNPAHHQLTIRTQVSSKAPVQVELVSLLGQTLRTREVTAAKLQREGVQLPLNDVSAGVYVVRLTTSEGTITKKVVVQ